MPTDLIGHPNPLAAAAFFGSPCQTLHPAGKLAGFLFGADSTTDWRPRGRCNMAARGWVGEGRGNHGMALPGYDQDCELVDEDGGGDHTV